MLGKSFQKELKLKLSKKSLAGFAGHELRVKFKKVVSNRPCLANCKFGLSALSPSENTEE